MLVTMKSSVTTKGKLDICFQSLKECDHSSIDKRESSQQNRLSIQEVLSLCGNEGIGFEDFSDDEKNLVEGIRRGNRPLIAWIEFIMVKVTLFLL